MTSLGWLIVAFFVVTASPALGHVRGWQVVEIPPVPADSAGIQVDGDDSDWRGAFGGPLFTEADLHAWEFDSDGRLVDRQVVDTESLRCDVWLAWSRMRLCGMVTRWDDHHVNELTTPRDFNGPNYRSVILKNDSFAIHIDADHSAGLSHSNLREQFRDRTFQTWGFLEGASRTGDAGLSTTEFIGREWVMDRVSFAGSLSPGDPAVSRTEFCVAAWDSLEPSLGEQANPPHVFQAGDTVGLQIRLMDYDVLREGSDVVSPYPFGFAALGTVSPVMAYSDGGLLPDFVLGREPPTAVRSKPWAKVKSMGTGHN